MEEQLEILKMVEAGQIDAAQASALLAALDESPTAAPAETSGRAEGRADAPSENRWARFWIYPALAGVGVLIIGALVLLLVYVTGAAAGWLVCGWPLLLLGLLVALLALWSRQATWMHLRVKESGGRKIALSFPVPLGLAGWLMRIVQPFVPQLRETGVDDLIIALRESTNRGEPLFIDVQDDEGDESVQLYLG